MADAVGEMRNVPPGIVTAFAMDSAVSLKIGPTIAATPTSSTRWVAAAVEASMPAVSSQRIHATRRSPCSVVSSLKSSMASCTAFSSGCTRFVNGWPVGMIDPMNTTLSRSEGQTIS